MMIAGLSAYGLCERLGCLQLLTQCLGDLRPVQGLGDSVGHSSPSMPSHCSPWLVC